MDLPEELLNLLRSKTDLTEAELENIGENNYWRIVQALRQLNEGPTSENIEVFFSGFSPDEERELTRKAIESDYHVPKKITKNLTFLCCTENVEPSVISQVRGNGISLIDKGGFLRILEFGDLPKILKRSTLK